MWIVDKKIARAGLAAAALMLSQLSPATAADMYDKYGQGSSPYDDPRYADVYQYPAPPAPPRYAEPTPGYEPREERPYTYLDEAPSPDRDRYGYLRPMRPHRYRHAEPSCIPHEEIRRSLFAEGWRDFRDLELRGETAVVQARRPNGRLYTLRVDRCSGEIVNAQPLEDRPVPYAYRDRYGGRAY